jgi:hypothetical protein
MYEWSKNADVDQCLLYECVNVYLKRLVAVDAAEISQASKIELYKRCLAYPAHLFIKSEPTKTGKIARPIYGLSLIWNVFSRILFGDYLMQIRETWSSCEHKVGFDMYSDQGLRHFRQFVDNMFDIAGSDYVVCSDDIQGWEYMSREWMHLSWHEAYLTEANASTFHQDLQIKFALIETKLLVIDSDGYLHDSEMYHTFSGRVLTHLQNSDERSALAMLDNNVDLDVVSNMTNGDDCVLLLSKTDSTSPSSLVSAKLGWKHTDEIFLIRNCIVFCSNMFFTTNDGSYIRCPENLSKTFFNAVSRSTSEESRAGIAANIADHPASFQFEQLVALCDAYEELSEQSASPGLGSQT